MKPQLKQLQALKAGLDQLRTESQNIREQTLGLTGDLQPLKNAAELYKGEVEIVKGEMKLLRESHDSHKATFSSRKHNSTSSCRSSRTAW